MLTRDVSDEKGMRYNPLTQCWEGNENVLSAFHSNPSTTTLPLHPTHNEAHSHHHTKSIPNFPTTSLPTQQVVDRPTAISSPPRATPALISHISTTRGVQVERGMVFDPRQMKWLKLDARSLAQHNNAGAGGNDMLSPSSMSVEEEEDPFAGLEDLPDENARPDTAMGKRDSNRDSAVFGGTMGGSGALGYGDDFGGGAGMLGGGRGGGGGMDNTVVAEEFDVGPEFVKRQKAEEANGRRRVDVWFGGWEEVRRGYDEGWSWGIREQAGRWEESRRVM